MVAKLSSQKYNGSRGKSDLLKKITEKLLKIDPSEVTPELVWAAYGLGQLTCGKHVVANPKVSNCKENPYCLGRLGLEKFEKLIKKSEELRNEKMVDSVRRDSTVTPCGLVNYSNFCYVNSFLQIWFNDPVFRQIIYDWRPSEHYEIPDPPAMDVQLVMNCLQKLFFTLDTSPYEDANGEDFCTALRLNNEQQDAQEFTIMFFGSIDRNLMKHPNGQEMRDRISERFNGLQTIVLRCKCGHHSDNTTSISALNLSIDGHSTLSGAIQGYFANEHLDDFVCSGCNKRGGVVKETRLDHMPPVILISLNRYVYDGNTGRRKKLKTAVAYARTLNMDRLVPTGEKISEEDGKYDLSAVMVHEGDSADCGHYWDLVRHPFTGTWFKYNDKTVKEAKPPGTETDEKRAKDPSTKKSETPIDFKYCYGLVYRRRESPKQPFPPPEEICGKWTKEMDHKFYRMTDADAEASEITVEEVCQRFSVVGDHMSALEVKPERAFLKRARDIAFLPTKLLLDLLFTEYSRAVKLKEDLDKIADELDRSTCEDEDKAAAVSNSDPDLSSPQKRKKNVRRRVKSMYDKRLEQVEIAMSLSPASLTLCAHERISFHSVLNGEVKAVARAGAEKLIKDYGLLVKVVGADGAVRTDRLRTGLELCTECVQDKTREVHFSSRLEEDTALAQKIAREVNTRCSVKAFYNRQPPLGSFYVAKGSLATFKKDAQRERHNQMRAELSAPRSTWTIGPPEATRAAAEAAAAAVVPAATAADTGGTDRERRRRKRAGGVEREAAGGGEEAEGDEQPVTKCARGEDSDESMEGRRKNGGNGQQTEEGGEDKEKDEVEETIRDMMDELAGPSQSTVSSIDSSLNGHPAAAAAAATVAEKEEEQPREAAGKENGRRRSVRKAKEEEKKEPEEDEQMKAEDEDTVDDEMKEVKEVKQRDKKKREGKEGSNATDDSELPSSPADAENGQEEGEENGRNGSTSNDEEDNSPIEFNGLLRCDHGGINVNEFRHMVSEEEWGRLARHFMLAFEVSTRDPVCEECKSFDAHMTADKQASSAILKALNEEVGDILKIADKRAATAAAAAAAGTASDGGDFARGVCSIFVESAKKVLNPRTKNRALPALCQSCLLCDHGQPRFGTQPMDARRPFIVPLTLDEWTRLKAAWTSALEANGSPSSDDEDVFAAADIELCPMTGAVPDQCMQCYESLREEIEAQKYIYENETIYVKMQADEQPSSKNSEKEEKEEKRGKRGDKGSKEGSKESKEGSEETPDIAPLEIVTAPPPSAPPSNGGGRLVGGVTVGGRSNTRRGASKGLIKVKMSSHQTIKDLKIALYRHVNYAPVDQLLYSTIGGDPLDDELTLMEARVPPGNCDTPIILIVQSSPDVMLCSPTNEKKRAVERGFYDTALAHWEDL